MKKFKHALRGLLTALRSEWNLRFHITAAILVTAAGFWLKIQLPEWVMLLLAITLVIAFELINTAIEYLCNAVIPEQHPLIKKTKDIAAAAVLVTAVGAAIIGSIIFLPKIILQF